MKQMAHFDVVAARSNPHIRLAVIAPRNEGKSVSENYRSHGPSSPWEHEVFETREAAEAWLGLEFFAP